MVEKITAEAKKMRKANPKLTWQQALKKAGAKLRGTKTTKPKTTRSRKISIKSTGIKKVGSIGLKQTGIKTIGSVSKFKSVSNKYAFYPLGAGLADILRFMLKHDKEIFGKSIKSLSWFTLLDKYPFVIDVLEMNKIDIDPMLDDNYANRFWTKIKSDKTMGATRSKKLISIPKSKIDKMTLNQVYKALEKAEYEPVYTNATYNYLDNRLLILSGKLPGKKVSGDLLIMHKGSKTRSQKKFGAIPGPSDPDAVREIELYIENDGDLYRQQTYPILKNLTKKYVKGTFKIEPAAKLFRYLIDNGMKKYHREFGSRSTPWHKLLSTSDRQFLAIKMATDTLTELNAGNRWEL